MTKFKASYKNTLNYLKNKLSNKERHVFEKNVMANLFEEDALEGFESLSPNELETDYKKLGIKLNTRSKKNNRKIFFLRTRIAASVLLFIGLGSLVYVLNIEQPQLKEFENTKPIVNSPDIETSKETLDFEIEAIEEIKNDDEDVIVSIHLEEKEIHNDIKIQTKGKNVFESIVEDEMNIETPILESVVVSNEQDLEIIQYNKTGNLELTRSVTSVTAESFDSISTTNIEEALIGKVARVKIQERKLISGIITDADGNPLPGATITIEGNDTKTISDFDGNFKLEVQENEKLVFDYIGFKQAIQPVNNDMSVAMESSEDTLDEVVVIGYGTVRKNKKNTTHHKTKNKDSKYISSIPPNESIENYKTWVLSQIDKSIFKKEKYYQIKCLFTVSKKGQLTDIKIFNYKSYKIKTAFKQIIKKSPVWQPAMKDNSPVTQKIELIFDIQTE